MSKGQYLKAVGTMAVLFEGLHAHAARTCEDSHNLAQLLLAFGYTEINVFIDGFPGWESEGHPIE